MFCQCDIFNLVLLKPICMQTVYIQISWLLKKPTDLDLHCLSLSECSYINSQDQVI